MLKIDSTKNFSAPSVGRSKLNSSNSGENSRSVDDSSSEDLSVESHNFARVLENLSKETKPEKQTSDQSKEVKKDTDKFHEKNDNKPVLENQRDQKSDDRGLNQSAAAAANSRAALQENNVVEAEQFVPPARSIMHVADLERIVSGFRTQLVDGNQQVVITLKNSVFSGLQIKLTTDENRRVTAEFIASNEKIKAQLDLRANELTSLLRQRGVQLNSLQTTVDSGSSDNNQNQHQAENYAAPPTSQKLSRNYAEENVLTDETEKLSESDFDNNSYRA